MKRGQVVDAATYIPRFVLIWRDLEHAGLFISCWSHIRRAAGWSNNVYAYCSGHRHSHIRTLRHIWFIRKETRTWEVDDQYDFDKWMILLCVLSVIWKHDAWLGWIKPARAAAIQPVLLFLTRPSPYSSRPHIAATYPSPAILLLPMLADKLRHLLQVLQPAECGDAILVLM